MKRSFFIVGVLAALTCVAWAVDVARELDTAAQVVHDMSSSNQIPASYLNSSECIAVFPKLSKGGFIVGGEHGNGFASCRTSSGWSAPAFISITGASIGFQAGAEHQDIILLMNGEGKQELKNGHWDLGAEAVAAGPTGASVGTGQSTGWKAPVLSYSRSSGAYAGANLQGSKISADQDMIHNIYGENASFESVLSGQAQPPASAQKFLDALPPAQGQK